MAYGTRERARGRRDRRPGQRLRGRGQAAGVGRRRRGLGLRRAVRDRGRRRARRAAGASPPSTSWCRPSTGPTGWPGWSRWDAALAEEVSAEVDRIVAASSRRADLEATLATSGIACLVDGPEEALAVANAIAPEHLQLMVPEDEGLALLDARAERRRGLHRRLVAGQHGRLHRRAQPRAADQPHGALRLGAAGRRLPQAPARGPRDARGAAHARPARRHAGRDRGPAGPRRLGAAPARRARRASGARERRAAGAPRPGRWPRATTRPRSRRRCGSTPTSRPSRRRTPGARSCWPRLEEVSFHRYPDRAGHRAAPGRGRPARGRRPTRSSAPTAPTRCSSACCWPSAARAGAPWSSSPPTPCTRTSRGSPAPRWSRARATTTS